MLLLLAATDWLSEWVTAVNNVLLFFLLFLRCLCYFVCFYDRYKPSFGVALRLPSMCTQHSSSVFIISSTIFCCCSEIPFVAMLGVLMPFEMATTSSLVISLNRCRTSFYHPLDSLLIRRKWTRDGGSIMRRTASPAHTRDNYKNNNIEDMYLFNVNWLFIFLLSRKCLLFLFRSFKMCSIVFIIVLACHLNRFSAGKTTIVFAIRHLSRRLPYASAIGV